MDTESYLYRLSWSVGWSTAVWNVLYNMNCTTVYYGMPRRRTAAWPTSRYYLKNQGSASPRFLCQACGENMVQAGPELCNNNLFCLFVVRFLRLTRVGGSTATSNEPTHTTPHFVRSADCTPSIEPPRAPFAQYLGERASTVPRHFTTLHQVLVTGCRGTRFPGTRPLASCSSWFSGGLKV